MKESTDLQYERHGKDLSRTRVMQALDGPLNGQIVRIAL